MSRKVVPIKTPGQRVIDGLQEAVAVAKGETQPARVHVVPAWLETPSISNLDSGKPPKHILTPCHVAGLRDEEVILHGDEPKNAD